MMTWALVPAKDLDRAKTRLSPLLGASERRELALAMLKDVFSALTRGAGNFEGLAVVTSDARVAALARLWALRVIGETGDNGLLPALRHAGERLRADGANRLMVLPGDLPLLDHLAIRSFLRAAATHPSITIAPDRRMTGTNCLLLTPPDVIPWRFGPNSYDLHRAEAGKRAIPVIPVSDPAFALDLDRPGDILQFLAGERPGHTTSFLKDADIALRLQKKSISRTETNAHAFRSPHA